VNGSLKHNGDTNELLASLRTLVAPLVFDEALTDQVCQDIIRASSRTASGGDTYRCVPRQLYFVSDHCMHICVYAVAVVCTSSMIG
jgi:hypothetical protein